MTKTAANMHTAISDRPLYQQVEDFVCRQINDGRFQPGHRLEPAELSRSTKISRGVVQQALQSLSSKGILIRRPRSGTFVADGASQRISPPTADNGSVHSVALVMPYLQIPEFARLAQALANTARSHGLDLLIAGTDNRLELYEQTLRRQLRSGVFGIIIVPPIDAVLPMDLLQDIEASGVPVVCCHGPIAGASWPVVAQDMEDAGRVAAEHLIEQGRRALAFVGYRRPLFDSGSMFEGFARTLFQHVDKVDEVSELRLDVPTDPERWADDKDLLPELRRFIVTRPQLDGICCQSDRLANVVAQIFQSVMGRAVPATASIVGNGNYHEYSSYASGRIATIDPYCGQFGEALVQQLIAARKGATTPNKKIGIRGELRLRYSPPQTDALVGS